MKKFSLSQTLALSAMLVFNMSLSAQHGRSGGAGAAMGGGVGAGAGAGAGAGMDAGAGMGAGMGGNATMGRANAGLNGASNANLASQAPGSVLSNSHLNTSLTSALGKSGVTIPGGNLQTACGGFKNLGACVAAMHVSQNLNIPFADLQSRMTGSGAVSLGKAIQQTAGTGVNAKAEAKKANKQAKADIHASQQPSSTASAS